MAIPMIVYNELLYTIGAKIARITYSVIGKILIPEAYSQTWIPRGSYRKG